MIRVLTGIGLIVLSLIWSDQVFADIYSYQNKVGEYVVSKDRPKDIEEYAVLTDEGEFIRLVSTRRNNVPITHWRPWFIPKEPHPYDYQPPESGEEQTPVITIEEDSESTKQE